MYTMSLWLWNNLGLFNRSYRTIDTMLWHLKVCKLHTLKKLKTSWHAHDWHHAIHLLAPWLQTGMDPTPLRSHKLPPVTGWSYLPKLARFRKFPGIPCSSSFSDRCQSGAGLISRSWPHLVTIVAMFRWAVWRGTRGGGLHIGSVVQGYRSGRGRMIESQAMTQLLYARAGSTRLIRPGIDRKWWG
jgi:hypothetical protein